MPAYYNEFDPFAAAWLRELIHAGLIPEGDVDERDIREVQPEDLRGYAQCHFFAGIGGWAYALRLAGWPDERPVWTGSPPCQPFSTAGKGLGKRDERHLAPVWLELVRAVRPPVLFGEQVAAAVTKDAWLDDLLDALERAGYATGAAVAPACSVGAPHIRQRLWFVAERLGDSDDERSQGRDGMPECADQQSSGTRGVACGTIEAEGFWRDSDWAFCRDEKWRAVEPTIFPLADGVPNRVGPLRGAGNAIVPQVAAEVIRVFMDR